MLKVGITGGIGSGKSSVCKIFEVLGVPIYYADDRAKALMTTNTDLIAGIKERFGEAAYVNGQLDRGYLAGKVFNNKEALAALNALVHPAVALDAERWHKEHLKAPYTLKEAALLFEAGSYKQLDKIIVVTAPKKVRIQRVMQRDNVTAELVEARMNNQWPEEKKVALADYVIDNSGEQELIDQVMQLHQQLLKEAQ